MNRKSLLVSVSCLSSMCSPFINAYAQGGQNLAAACVMESASQVSVSRCDASGGSGLCLQAFYQNVTFQKTFAVPPHVFVSPENATDGNTSCAGSATDKVVCYPKNITAIGFRLVCAGSPVSDSCGAGNGYSSRATAAWVAVDAAAACRAVSGHNITPNLCSGSNIGGLCTGTWSSTSTFATPLSTIPKLISGPENVSNQGGCVGGATDTVTVSSSQVSATGFRLTAAGSPAGNGCGTSNGYASLATAGYLGVVDRPACQVESAELIEANICTGSLVSGTCSSAFRKIIVFGKMFKTPPTVIVTPQRISSNPPCAGGATDKVFCRVLPGSVTTVGMVVQCSGSPVGTGCGAQVEGYSTRAKFGYMAIESECHIEACRDGIDNDGDGKIDTLDPDCLGPEDDSETNNAVACADGVDNDNDGAVDFPQDFSCSDAQDIDEANPKSQCQDTIDNDGDGVIDLVDPGCTSSQDNDESSELLNLSVSVECVLDNFDGTKTAFFSYNNPTGETISIAIGSTSSPTTRNDVSPGGPNLAQPTAFAPGINKGAFSVALSGSSVTWNIRPLGGAVSTAMASAASPSCATVQPLAECQGFNNGVLRALGGYQNLNNFAVQIPIGTLNNFSPGNQNQGQPEKFLAGLNRGAFNINLANTSTVLTWTLNGLQAVASTSLPICSGECIDTPVGSITDEINQLAVQIANITKQAAAILSSAEADVAKGKSGSSKKKIRRQSRIAANADRIDAERATRKANAYVTQSQELTIQIPDVIKNCPEAPQFCQTVDNGPTIDALRELFMQARNTAQRTIARAYFRNTGTTNRKDSLVAQAKSLEKQGLAQLDQIPRTSAECK